jgi:hypothetical protein
MVLLVKDKEQKRIALLECLRQRPWDWTAQIIVGQIPEKCMSLGLASNTNTGQDNKTSKIYLQENKV